MFESLVEVGDRLATLVGRLDPDAISGSAANQCWGQLDRIERLAAAGKTLLVRRIADTHSPQLGQAKTAAEALARRGGTTIGAARDAIETSRRLGQLPQLEAAVRRGDLSAAQTAAISDAAAADPAAQHRLVEQAARSSMPELREECLRTKAAADPDPETTHARIHRNRYLRRFTDREGGWNLHARGTAEQGALINTILDSITEKIFHTARRAGRTEPRDAYAFDALVTLAEGASAGAGSVGPTGSAASEPASQPATDANGEPGPSASTEVGEPAPSGAATAAEPDPHVEPEPADPSAAKADNHSRHGGGGPAAADPATPATTGRPRVNPRFLALLRIDLEALRRGHVESDELCEITGVGPIPVARARELLGQAVLHLVITRGVDVLNVTHLGRGPTAAQRIALAWTSPTCVVAGCHRARIEIDHRTPWATTRHTRLDDLDPLCPFHHDLKTRFGWALVAGTGKRPMVPPTTPDTRDFALALKRAPDHHRGRQTRRSALRTGQHKRPCPTHLAIRHKLRRSACGRREHVEDVCEHLEGATRGVSPPRTPRRCPWNTSVAVENTVELAEIHGAAERDHCRMTNAASSRD